MVVFHPETNCECLFCPLRLCCIGLISNFASSVQRYGSAEKGHSYHMFKELLKALDAFLHCDKAHENSTRFIFVGVNADTEGYEIGEAAVKFCQEHADSTSMFNSVRREYYLGLMRNGVDLLVGNSSSGLYEMPSCKKPTVNIGNRQGGRLRAKSVVDTPGKASGEILDAILKAKSLDCSNVVNPYGDGNSAASILKVLRSYRDFKLLLHKKWHEVVTH